MVVEVIKYEKMGDCERTRVSEGEGKEGKYTGGQGGSGAVGQWGVKE